MYEKIDRSRQSKVTRTRAFKGAGPARTKAGWNAATSGREFGRVGQSKNQNGEWDALPDVTESNPNGYCGFLIVTETRRVG